ncbi:hypothetical protein ABH897_000718, partial [Paenibacillus sp. RC73]
WNTYWVIHRSCLISVKNTTLQKARHEPSNDKYSLINHRDYSGNSRRVEKVSN